MSGLVGFSTSAYSTANSASCCSQYPAAGPCQHASKLPLRSTKICRMAQAATAASTKAQPQSDVPDHLQGQMVGAACGSAPSAAHLGSGLGTRPRGRGPAAGHHRPDDRRSADAAPAGRKQQSMILLHCTQIKWWPKTSSKAIAAAGCVSKPHLDCNCCLAPPRHVHPPKAALADLLEEGQLLVHDLRRGSSNESLNTLEHWQECCAEAVQR